MSEPSATGIIASRGDTASDLRTEAESSRETAFWKLNQAGAVRTDSFLKAHIRCRNRERIRQRGLCRRNSASWRQRRCTDSAMLVSHMPRRMMVHCISVVLAAGILGTSALPQRKSRAVAQEQMQTTSTGIVGFCKVTELLSRVAGENWTNISPQLSL